VPARAASATVLEEPQAAYLPPVKGSQPVQTQASHRPPAPTQATQLPVAQAPAAQPQAASLSTELGERWHALAQQMIDAGSISALVRELAMQAQCVFIDDAAQPALFRLRVARENLRTESQLEKLQTALGECLQREVRTAADYGRSLALLARAKRMSPGGLVKSGLIVGLGEAKDEVLGALADLRAVGVDIVTVGQYLRPTARNRPIHRYVTPEEFAAYRAHGAALGLSRVEAGPLVRSSYHAGEAREAAG